MFKAICMSLLFNRCNSFKVNLFTGKSCRQCIKFKKIFTGLIEKYPDVDFEKIELAGGPSNIEAYNRAKMMKINVVPMIVFEDDYGEEESRITAISKNYKEIENVCKKYSNFSEELKSSGTEQSMNKKCEWIVKEMGTNENTVLTREHLELSKLCDNIYSDEFLRNTEAYVENTQTDSQCGMVMSGSKLLVCFRGSDSATDWRLNFYVTLSEFPCGSGRYVHSGFLSQWLSIQAEFTEKFLYMMDKHIDNIDEVIFCGHSAGTVSCIAAYIMEPVITETYSKSTKIITYGAPRMCNDEFKKNLEKKVDCTRIVLDRDVITRVPFPVFGYTHIGKPIQIREDCVVERDTTTLETLYWMFLGLPLADVGVRDHFIGNYTKAIKQWLKDQCVESSDPIIEPIVEEPTAEEPFIKESDSVEVEDKKE